MKPLDLWPADLYELLDTSRLPVHLLREQAAILGQKTQNIVIAEVETLDFADNIYIEYSFDIIAPCLGDYTTSIFSIACDLESLYPITIKNLLNLSYETTKADTEDELKAVIKKILAQPKVKEIVQNMLAHSK